MNQMLTEHHIAQYNILLIEDQTVNQTVNYNQIQFIPHMLYNNRMHPQFCKDKFDLFLTWKTIQNCSLEN